MNSVLTCIECELVVGCGDSLGNEKLCPHAFSADVVICTRNPGECAVSGNTKWVTPKEYPHQCRPKAQRTASGASAGWGG